MKESRSLFTLSVSSDGSFFIVGGLGIVTRFSSPPLVRELSLPFVNSFTTSALSPDNKRVFLGDPFREELVVLCSESLEVLDRVFTKGKGAVSLEVLGGQGRLLCGFHDGSLALYDLGTLEVVLESRRELGLSCVCLSRDQKTIFCGYEKQILVRSAESLAVEGRLKVPGRVSSIFWHEEGLFVAVEGSVFLLCQKSGRLVREYSSIHSKPIKRLKVRGDFIVTSSGDKTVRVTPLWKEIVKGEASVGDFGFVGGGLVKIDSLGLVELDQDFDRAIGRPRETTKESEGQLEKSLGNHLAGRELQEKSVRRLLEKLLEKSEFRGFARADEKKFSKIDRESPSRANLTIDANYHLKKNFFASPAGPFSSSKLEAESKQKSDPSLKPPHRLPNLRIYRVLDIAEHGEICADFDSNSSEDALSFSTSPRPPPIEKPGKTIPGLVLATEANQLFHESVARKLVISPSNST